MYKYILSKQKDYTIHEYNLEDNSITQWSIDRYINDHSDEVCDPYCQYSYAIYSIEEGLEEDLSEEDFKRCDTCDYCSNIEFDNNIRKDELISLQNYLACGDPNGFSLVLDTKKWELSMLSDSETNRYIGEFHSIKECRDFLATDSTTFD